MRSSRFVLLVLPLLALHVSAQTTSHPEPPPSQLAAAVASRLAAGGQRVTIGSAILDFWWVTGVPLRGPGAAWSQVEEGTLVGAVRVHAPYRDVRGRTMKPGVYTLRFAIQPQNGDHLGVSSYREFLLLAPASADTTPGAAGHERAVEMAKATLGTAHPAVWSLDPPSASEPVGTMRDSDADPALQAVVFEVPATRDGAAAGALRFGLVLIGRIDA